MEKKSKLIRLIDLIQYSVKSRDYTLMIIQITFITLSMWYTFNINLLGMISNSNTQYSNSSTITLNDIKRNMSNTNKEIVGSVRLPNGDVGLTYIDGNRGGVYTSIISTDSDGNSVIVKTYREDF